MLSPVQSHDLSRGSVSAPEARFSASEAGIIEGYASTFGGNPDSYGDVIAPGAYSKTLGDLKASGRSLPMLWSHDQGNVIGHWIDLTQDAKGLLAKGKLNLNTQRGQEVQAMLKAGDISGLSIGFSTAKYSPGKSGVRRILEAIDLWEISVVAFPANASARVTGAKSVASKADLVELLKDAGLSNAAARKIAGGGFAALSSHDDDIGYLLRHVQAATDELKALKG